MILQPHTPPESKYTPIPYPKPSQVNTESDPGKELICDNNSWTPKYCREKAGEYLKARNEAYTIAATNYQRGNLTGYGSAQYYSDVVFKCNFCFFFLKYL